MALDDPRPDEDDEDVDFGGAVKNELRNQGRNQEWLAHAVGVDRATVSRLLAGQRSPTLDEVVTYATALGLEPGDLLRAAGYVASDTTTEKMIKADPALDTQARDMLLVMYQQATKGRR